MRRRRDGTLHVTDTPPAEHWFSAGFIDEGVARGEVEVTVTIKAATGDLTYQLVDLAGEDGQRNPVAWHVRLAGEEG